MRISAVILLLAMFGCEKTPVKPSPAAKSDAGTCYYEGTCQLYDNKWEKSPIVVDAHMDTIQITKYKYSCPSGYELAVYGDACGWRDEAECSHMDGSRSILPYMGDPVMDKPSDALHCLLAPAHSKDTFTGPGTAGVN